MDKKMKLERETVLLLPFSWEKGDYRLASSPSSSSCLEAPESELPLATYCTKLHFGLKRACDEPIVEIDCSEVRPAHQMGRPQREEEARLQPDPHLCPATATKT